MNESIKKLIQTDFPDLKVLTISTIGEGWDNAAYLVNNRYVFRIPKEISMLHSSERIAHTKVEVKTLRLLTDKISANVPEVTHIAPSYGYYGYRYIVGAKVNPKTMTNDAKKDFLRLWIDSATQIAIELSSNASGIGLGTFPGNDYRILQARKAIQTSNLNSKQKSFGEQIISTYTELWERAKKVPVHGDFGAGNWLYDPLSDTFTIIDWSDVCLAPQEFQMYRFVIDFPEYTEQLAQDYESITGDKINLPLLIAAGAVSDLSIIGELLGKDDDYMSNKLVSYNKWRELHTKLSL